MMVARSHNNGHGPPPLGMRMVKYLKGNRELSYSTHKALVLLLTFLAYTLYHASRKPSSIVKTILQSPTPSSSFLHTTNTNTNTNTNYNTTINNYVNVNVNANSNSNTRTGIRGRTPSWPLDRIFTRHPNPGHHRSLQHVDLQGWAPFEGDPGVARLGEVDVAFLAMYALGMYFVGHLGDRMSLRLILGMGMIGSGACVCLFGMAYWWDIHSLFYFLVLQMVAGLLQATGWPYVVTVVGNWFGKERRGLIMGVWNAHTSVGNISGSLVASAMLRYGWGWSFILPGTSIALGGLLLFFFLVPHPSSLSMQCHGNMEAQYTAIDDDHNDTETQFKALDKDRESHAIGFLQAWAIPGVAPFAFCLFFAKLVAYTFLYWLPFYIRNTKIQGEYFSDSTSGNLSTVFDIGGVFGGIIAGHLSDNFNASATVAVTFMFGAVPTLLMYRVCGSLSLWVNITLLVMLGMLINGPYALITTAVSTDLGTHNSLKGNRRALATVTAIIDGTGSIGATLGPLLTGFISTRGWNNVFFMLMASAFLAGLMLSKLVFLELKEKLQRLKTLPPQRDAIAQH